MNYLKPWRRKIGLLTLLLACVFTAGWVRSRSLVDDYCTGNGTEPDRLRIRSGADRITLISEHNELNWNRGGGWGYRRLEAKDLVNSPTGYQFEIDEHIFELDSKLHVFGFDFGFLREVSQPQSRNFRATFYTVPYWAFIAPLTVLSAWLLLSKPRTVNHIKSPITTAN